MSESPNSRPGRIAIGGAPPALPAAETRPRPEQRPAPAATGDPKTAYTVLREARPQAIVVHCSDPRFQSAFTQFIRQELGLMDGEFIPIVVGGGGGVLGHPEQLPKEFKFLKDRFEHYRRIFPTARRLVLINHEGCRYYESVRGKIEHLIGPRLACVIEQARVDLDLVRRIFDRLLAHLGFEIELYYARFADAEHSRIVFEKVGAVAR